MRGPLYVLFLSFKNVISSCTAAVNHYNYNEQHNQRGKQYLMEPVMGLI